MGAATLSLLARAAEDAPLAVLVDDAHLLDAPSTEALVFAARRLVSDAVAMLLTVRADEPGAEAWAPLPTLIVRGLDLASADELVHHTFGRCPQRPVGDVCTGPQPATRSGCWSSAAASDDVETVPAESAMAVSDRISRSFMGRAGDLRRRCSPGAARRGGRQRERGHGAPGVRDPRRGSGIARRRRGCGAGHGAWRPGGVPSPAGALGGVRRRRPGDPSRGAPGAGRRGASRGDVPARVAPLAQCRRAGRGDGGDPRRGRRPGVATEVPTRSRPARTSAPRPSPRLPTQLAPRLAAAAEAAWLAGLTDRAVDLLDRALAAQPDPYLRAHIHELRGAVETRGGSLETAHALLVAAAREIEDLDPDRAVRMYADAVHVCFYRARADDAVRAARPSTDCWRHTSDPTRGTSARSRRAWRWC